MSEVISQWRKKPVGNGLDISVGGGRGGRGIVIFKLDNQGMSHER